MSFICSNCQSVQCEKVDTYKHSWFICAFCRNMISATKLRYPMEGVVRHLYQKIYPYIKRIPKLRGLIGWFPLLMRGVGNKESYEVYLNENFKLDKYKGEFDRFHALLNQTGVHIKDMNLIDISGEPGLFALKAKEYFQQVVLTAYSSKVADFLKEKLKIEVVDYDFNDAAYKNFIIDKFDFITARYCINFCNDIEDFLSNLDRIAKSRAYVYLSFLTPSKGTILGNQLCDYAYHQLYTPDRLIKIMYKIGYNVVYQGEDGLPVNILSPINYPEKIIYKLYAKKNSFTDGDCYQYNYVLLFQRKD